MYHYFKKQIAEAMDLPTDRIRLWVMQKRINDTIRPTKLIMDDVTLRALLSLVNYVRLTFGLIVRHSRPLHSYG